MRLDQALVHAHLCESRQEAQELIKKSAVLVDGIVVTKQTKKVLQDSKLEVTSRRTFVSRGGNKLEGALGRIFGDATGIRAHLRGKTALDIGSSTGGFTECLLMYGVDTVTAVDVGTSQLHPRLLANPRVTSLEHTDIRNYIRTKSYDCIVADLSFISLANVFDKVFSFGAQGTHFFILIKPQFEVGKGNSKKGIVKDETLVTEILEKYRLFSVEKGLLDIQIFPCSIAGGDGNQEYFLYCKK